MTGEAPLFRWDAGEGRLVSDHGLDTTKAQRIKADRMVSDRLIHMVDQVVNGPDWVTTRYRIDPVPGCRRPNEVFHTRMKLPNGETQHSYRCGCQRFRGTRAMSGGTCSHILGLARYLAENREAES